MCFDSRTHVQGGGMPGGPGNPLAFGKSKARFQMEPNTGAACLGCFFSYTALPAVPCAHCIGSACCEHGLPACGMGPVVAAAAHSLLAKAALALCSLQA